MLDTLITLLLVVVGAAGVFIGWKARGMADRFRKPRT